MKVETHNTAPRTQASEERLRCLMLRDRSLQEATGLGPEYDEYFEALFDECAATAHTTDWEYAQRLKAAGYRDWAECADAAAREREAYLDALWTEAEARASEARRLGAIQAHRSDADG